MSGEEEGREKELNVQHSTPNAQRRIKEILNKEKEMTNDEKSVKEHLSEIQKGGTRRFIEKEWRIMIMTVKTAKNSGWVLTELIVSIGILGVIMGGLYTSMNTCRVFNKYQLLRQRCVAAAQAQLESIAATGEKISDKNNERLWPDVEISVERKDGSGDWQGLRLTTVTARNVRLNKTVSIELSRYLPVEQEVN